MNLLTERASSSELRARLPSVLTVYIFSALSAVSRAISVKFLSLKVPIIKAVRLSGKYKSSDSLSFSAAEELCEPSIIITGDCFFIISNLPGHAAVSSPLYISLSEMEKPFSRSAMQDSIASAAFSVWNFPGSEMLISL